MKLYVQFAQPYEGYVSGRFDAAAGAWEPLRLGDAPEHIGHLLGRSGARFFLGTLGTRRCLCIRGIPDEIRDENGRECFIHMLVDAPLSQRRAVDRLAAFALAETPRFQAEMRSVLQRGPEPSLNADLARALLHQEDEWKLPGRPGDTLIMPEQSMAHFTRETGLNPGAVHLLSAEDAPVELFFYCSAPADGYTFTRVEGAGGKTLARRDEAAAALPAGLYRRITTQGEDSALFREEGRWCFFTRPIPTEQNGSLALAAVSADEASLHSMAAFAKENPAELRSLAAACIVPCPAEGEYAVDAEKAAALSRRMLDRGRAERVSGPENPVRTAKASPPDPGREDEERIDLLKCRWFLPVAIAAGAVASTGLVWMLLRLIQ